MDLRDLPSIDGLASAMTAEFGRIPRPVVVATCRTVLDQARSDLLAGGEADPVVEASERLADIDAARPQAVINATGVLLHTNLGRASMPPSAAARLAGLATMPGNVEIDIRTGRRAKRNDYLGALLPAATGAEAGFAVNNNAGALLLALASVAGNGGKVAVSRGELIEIGGSFRLPELMRASGATLVEVGTTNRTRLSDFAAAAESVDAILKVHPSNYRIEGFQEEASHHDLSALAAEHDIPFIFDVGSGLIDEESPWLGDGPRSWIAEEPGVSQAVAAGADLVLFSGDKLLGGPQAGIIVGTSAAVEAAASHPIARAVRLDGGTIAAVAETVEMYLDKRVLDIPFWAMAAASLESVDERAQAVAAGIEGVTIEDSGSVPGAGSVPGLTIPTRVLRLPGNADAVWSSLASAQPPVIGTRRDGAVYLDLRSVPPEQDEKVAAAIRVALA
ncbi:MAG: L-seryl-tRNA(Sec) selenium transferase [Acidimicrobiia bacterium]